MNDDRIPVHNATAMPMYVAGAMIPPGETRHFPAHQVPAHLRPAPKEAEPEAPADPLAELVKRPVKEIEHALSGLSDADLVRLIELDAADGTPRKTLAEEVAEEQLRRASAKAEGGAE